MTPRRCVASLVGDTIRAPKILDIVADKAWAKWMKQNDAKLVRYARQEAPVRTGKLRRNIKVRQYPGRRAQLVAETDYAAAVHDGRRAVYPVKAKALRWIGAGGVVVFSHRSKATQPNPFLIRACVKFGLTVKPK